jgi:DNA-binding response OmpR family regulator
MFVAVYPSSPSGPLVDALIEAGYQPVPIEGLDDLHARSPHGGWTAVVVEATGDVGRALSFAAKVTDEVELPVMLVADRTATESMIGEVGFVDFLLSPVDRVELAVRMSRLTRAPTDVDQDVLVFHDLELNTATYQATVAGEHRDLTYMEYELLRFFVENAGRVWSREQILSRVWGYDYFGGSRTVDVHVRRLRAKLGEERANWIGTVRSVGYRFG